MVPVEELITKIQSDSPRIRGDGPAIGDHVVRVFVFSPYSRGWSQQPLILEWSTSILPVFAGMVPRPHRESGVSPYSPRIRGDGPELSLRIVDRKAFSPYSRGWSLPAYMHTIPGAILPVFAGMVPMRGFVNIAYVNSPRIRGDGPDINYAVYTTI